MTQLAAAAEPAPPCLCHGPDQKVPRPRRMQASSCRRSWCAPRRGHAAPVAKLYRPGVNIVYWRVGAGGEREEGDRRPHAAQGLRPVAGGRGPLLSPPRGIEKRVQHSVRLERGNERGENIEGWRSVLLLSKYVPPFFWHAKHEARFPDNSSAHCREIVGLSIHHRT